jgi:VIT1/CCC1 family predicted Fe2+/Mn2+ transporter
VVVPFTFMKDVTLALRISNGIAIAMLFGMGYAFGNLTGRRPAWAGVGMVVFGSALVSATIALGG